MTNYQWAIDGIPLETHAFNPVIVSSGRGAPLRGEDRIFSGVPGAEPGPRVEDSTSLTLGMWIMGDDHGATTDAGRIAAFQEHWRELRRLLRPDGDKFFDLTRTWTDDLGVHVATARGSVDEEPQLRQVNAYQAQLTIDVYLPDPFFYSAEQSAALTLGTPVDVVNAGDTSTTDVFLDFAGQLANPRVTNSTPAPDVWVQVGSAIAAGDEVTLDIEDSLATRVSDGANLIGAVTHSGSRAWFGLRRGTNTVTLTASSGTGAATLRWREKWI